MKDKTKASAAKAPAAKAKKPAKAAKASNAQVFAITATARMPTTIKGHVKTDGDQILINHKKRRSKKRVERVFSMSQVLGYCPGAEEDGGWIMVDTVSNVVDDDYSNVSIVDGVVTATDTGGRQCFFMTGPGKLDVVAQFETD